MKMNQDKSTGGLCIVLVDDEPHITHMVGRKLTLLGYTVHTAMDGQQGFELINEVNPDLVVTDLQMPYMSGIELASRMWTCPRLKDIPVVMLSARGFAVEQQIQELDNIRTLLSKPFSTRSLIDKIVAILSESDESQERCA